MKKPKTKPSGALQPIVDPLAACIRVERMLRGSISYHYAMDFPQCKIGLGQWLKRVIRHAKRSRG